ncbi:DUF3422 family protein [Roseiarcus sp.]|uniref:DUF3422 family protein n=1 Tax=Roseiarcus sp. TaxID=1969460 RepID=UPI003F979E50
MSLFKLGDGILAGFLNATQRALAPPDHPLRRRLNDEAHARPPERISAPARISFLALIATPEQRAQAWETIAELARRHGAPSVPDKADHYSADFGRFRLKAERHTEFMRVTVIVPSYGCGGPTQPFAETAIESADASWIADLPGEVICAIHALIAPAEQWPPNPVESSRDFGSMDGVVGAMISGGAGAAFTDLRIRDDGFGRLLILDHGMSQGKIGRSLQRLMEMDTYRMLALLAFPVARASMFELTKIERELTSVTEGLVSAQEEEERGLLERLTGLAAQVEHLQSESQFRFAAAASYYELVERRIGELREERIEGLPTFREFMDRRLAPAMRTCRTVAERQESLSARVARATELLSTRVEVSSQRQSHALLDSMNRRAQLQLRLQETVEGLSVAAITYYIVGLVGHAAEGLEVEGVPISPVLAMAVAIPIVLVLVAVGVRRIRKSVARAFGDTAD